MFYDYFTVREYNDVTEFPINVVYTIKIFDWALSSFSCLVNTLHRSGWWWTGSLSWEPGHKVGIHPGWDMLVHRRHIYTYVHLFYSTEMEDVYGDLMVMRTEWQLKYGNVWCKRSATPCSDWLETAWMQKYWKHKHTYNIFYQLSCNLSCNL